MIRLKPFIFIFLFFSLILLSACTTANQGPDQADQTAEKAVLEEPSDKTEEESGQLEALEKEQEKRQEDKKTSDQQQDTDKKKQDPSITQPYPGSVFKHEIDMKVNGVVKEGSDEEWWKSEENLKDKWDEEWWVLD